MSCLKPRIRSQTTLFFLNNGDENLISSATGNENEAASPNASQIPLRREGRDTDTAMHTDCSPQETTSEHPSPSGSTLLPKSQEPGSDPTNKPHAVLLSQQEQGQEVTSMEQNKDTLEAEKEQMNGQTEEVPQETTTSEEPANISESNSDRNDEEISVNKADKNEEEKTKEEEEEEEEKTKEEKEEEEDGLAELQQDDFQPSVEMSGQEYEKDKNNRPVCRYNTVCYRKIKKGNTMQRIDEFESMLNV